MAGDPLREDLAHRIAERQVVVFAGAGVARAATSKAPNWKELLRSGVERCVALDKAKRLPERWAERQGEALECGDLFDLLGVASQVTVRLGGTAGGEYRAWLKETLGALSVEDPGWIDALRDLGAPVFTTNYDDLLTNAWGVPPVTWKDPERIQEVLRGELDAVVHLHGHYSAPSSVVLGIASYEEVLGAEAAQSLLHAMSAMRTLVLIGFGAGLEDPNFTALRQWIARNFGGASYRHYRLVRDDEVASTQEKHPEAERIFAVSYGPDYGSLPEFLAGLRPRREKGRAPRSAPTSGEGREHDPLPFYLHHVRAANDHLVAFFQDRLTNAEMGKVYVKLNLSASTGREEPERGKEGFGHSLRELLAAGPSSDGSGARWMVRGDPGSGKTTLLRHLAWELAEETTPTWVPIYVRMRHLVEARGGKPWKRIQGLIQAHGHDADLLERLEELRAEGSLVVLLDGLDEVAPDKAEAARQLLVLLHRELGISRLVVTARRIGYVRPSAAFDEADVLDLDRDTQIQLLQKCLPEGGRPGGKKPRQWIDEFAGDAGLESFARNPLLLTLVALLLQSGGTPSSSRSELYDQVLDLLLEGKHKPAPDPVPCKPAVRVALACIAHRMTEEGETSADRGRLEQYLLHMKTLGPEAESELETLLAVPEWEGNPTSVLQGIANRTGILKDYETLDAPGSAIPDQGSSPWSFWHRTFQEALTSRRLLDLGRDRALELAAGISTRVDLWAEPFALLTGRFRDAGDADRLLRSLIETNQALGLRALATAQRVSVETLAGAIERLQEGEEEVWEVYGRVLELVGDPDRGLRLLNRLRQGTRNGNDLYHIDEAFLRAAEEHPDHADLAAHFRGRIFAHVDPPIDELFSKVDTCDGAVELWRTIPGGEFRMGSEADDEAAWGDEHPAHGVVLSPFALFAVPATNAQYRAFDPGHDVPVGLENHPVVTVSWYEAVMFCRWLGGRLPTEAEWEYACRAGTTTRYWSGDSEEDLARVGWYEANSEGRLHPVGEKPANPFGLYDVHGNVWEWCEDTWHGNYEGAPVDGTAWVDSGSESRVLRGGGFGSGARHARSAYRLSDHPSNRWRNRGFRPARVITE